jgi:hypothetical protein
MSNDTLRAPFNHHAASNAVVETHTHRGPEADGTDDVNLQAGAKVPPTLDHTLDHENVWSIVTDS